MPVSLTRPTYHQIGGGYSYAKLSVGMVVQNPNKEEIYCQSGDDETTMMDNINSLDEISEDINDGGRAIIADMLLGGYFNG